MTATGPTRSVVLVGGGGHAKVIRDVLEAAEMQIAGCVCPAGASLLADVPWLGEDDKLGLLAAQGHAAIHVAIGDNLLRQRLARRAQSNGLILVSAVHPRAIVSPRARLGNGVAVMAGAVVNSGAQVSDGAIVNTAATVDHDCDIGEFVHLAPGCHLAGNVTVGQGAFLGVGAAVIPRRQVGPWAVIGAGSVVIYDIPERVTALGVPARVVKRHVL